ncbi:unnamed protein product [Acanthoscelides obtectus]|uniref:Uncharacterized protein n=1 Tax=Acanthoscelides obtectus TaxID=200917 RepID=A0A9P0P1C8_ACAOB|nr:unnamed protein product [Acanthoscelides obtectus]CAK1639131.1 hypothetical protein AOBTE_LOCUS11009 [Acanthoscelides obtectus]
MNFTHVIGVFLSADLGHKYHLPFPSFCFFVVALSVARVVSSMFSKAIALFFIFLGIISIYVYILFIICGSTDSAANSCRKCSLFGSSKLLFIANRQSALIPAIRNLDCQRKLSEANVGYF